MHPLVRQIDSQNNTNNPLRPQETARGPSTTGTNDEDSHQLSVHHSYVALALAFCKSKAPGMALSEYVAKVKRQVKTAQGDESCSHLTVDSAYFWKTEFDKLYTEKKALEDRVAQLEAAADPETFQRNIRNLYEPFEVAKSVSKRYYSVDSRCCNEPLDTSLRYQNYSCMLLIKNAGILNSLVDNKAQSVAIYTAISESLLQVDNLIVASCTQPLQLPKLDCHHDISHNMSIVAAVFNLCLKGLIQLCQDISGRQQYKGVAISHLVHCIKRVLCHLQDMCIVVTKYAETGQEIRLVPHSQQSHDARVRSMLVTALSDLIADIFLCPLFAISTNTSIIHPAVTEALTGTLSVFLQRLGGCVSEKVFGDHLPSSSNPGHITKLQERVVPASHTAAIELEGANLVEILRRIMQSGDGKLLKLLADSPGDRQTTSNSGNGEIVLQSIKKQLQDTLMVGIFGDDGKDFLDTLKVPQSKELPPADHGSFMRVADGSFVNSVSDLLGWNLAFEHI